MLVPHGVLTEWDRYALERYCDLLVQYRSAADALAVDGLTHEVIDSQSRIQTKLRPEFEAQGKLAVLLAKLEACFGMTPADRARISIGGEPKEENPKERFFKTA
jgi:P27 family predicted phage terminase small subunit